MFDKRNNPVAKAVSRAKLRSLLVDAKINLYLLSDGEHCTDLIDGLADVLRIVGCATELQCHASRTGLPPSLSVLCGALSACKQILASGRYDTRQTTAIVVGLDVAETLNAKLSTRHIIRALQILGVSRAGQN